MIYGDLDLVVSVLKKSLSYGEKLKRIAKKKEDIDMAEATIQTAKAILAAVKGEKSIDDFKKEMWELEKLYPEVFQRGRRDIGTSEDNVKAIIHRVEYMINRYDVKYPSYDRHRCNDCG
jgi:hypothetical protein